MGEPQVLGSDDRASQLLSVRSRSVSSLTKADALALIGPESEGVRAGEPVEAIVLREVVVHGGQQKSDG